MYETQHSQWLCSPIPPLHIILHTFSLSLERIYTFILNMREGTRQDKLIGRCVVYALLLSISSHCPLLLSLPSEGGGDAYNMKNKSQVPPCLSMLHALGTDGRMGGCLPFSFLFPISNLGLGSSGFRMEPLLLYFCTNKQFAHAPPTHILMYMMIFRSL